ncbi:lysocardiolipin acyltransferase 1-like [Babylonia areolata]|uniref:lysocardiolipin acyltransferase 1-like n=1 Tax=Babylonia areolata TaxID=304850 RepID=UPI003FCFFA55
MATPGPQLWRGIVFAISLFLTCFFGTLVLLTPCLPLAFKLPSAGRRIMDAFLWLWFVFAAAMYELLLGIKVVIHGQPAPPGHSVLILCNHRTRLDWLFLVSYQLRCGALSHYRISLKKPLKSIPGPGWAMQCAGFLFLKREWKIDQSWITQALKYFAQTGTQPQFLLFPEGTDFCEDGLAKSDKFAKANNLPTYEYVLHPRTTGFIHFIKQMKENNIIDWVLDVTVGYPQNVVHGEGELVRGIAPREVHFLVQAHPISHLPQSAEKLEAWCRDVWLEKEGRLERFYREKSFAVNGEGLAVEEEVEASVQRLLWLVVGFWGLFMCGVVYALLAWPLFKWYCLLSALTFVFIGRSYGGVDNLLYATCA